MITLMSNLISLDEVSLNSLVSTVEEDVIHGLSKKRFGFLVSAPDMGKGYFCLSLSYELASGGSILGIGDGKEIKVLYWPIEDKANKLAERIKGHLQHMPLSKVSKIRANMKIWAGDDSICCSDMTKSSSAELLSKKAREDLIEASMDYDLLIIDTLREAVGNCDEVKDDYRIKVTLQEIAKKADIAILATHHLTKEGVRGNEKVSNVSGSGLSETMANSRYQLFLGKKTIGRNKAESLYFSHLKHNYVPHDEKISERLLSWSKGNLLISEYADLDGIDDLDESLDIPVFIEDKEPRTLSIDESVLSQASKDKANKAKKDSRVIDDKTLDEYEAFLASKSLKDRK
jgi:RecA-family ATPase